MNDKVEYGQWVILATGDYCFVTPRNVATIARESLTPSVQVVAPPKWFCELWVDRQAYALKEYELKSANKRVEQAIDETVKDAQEHARHKRNMMHRIAELEHGIKLAQEALQAQDINQALHALDYVYRPMGVAHD